MNYQTIQQTLTAAGVTVYDPGLKTGICTAPYVVVQESGTYPLAQS